MMMMMIALPTYAADNEIFITQSGTTANIDLEQLGSSNIIGGLNAAAGSMTTLDLDGNAFTLDINQIGNTNKFLGDIWGDNVTAFFEFDGDSNTFTIQADPTNTYGIDNSNLNVDVTGSTNTFTLNQGTTALAATLDLDWVINGTGNTVVSNINYDGATNFLDIDGNANTVNFTGSGYAGGYFYLDQTGNNMTFNVQQLSTQDNDWLKIISISNNTGSNTSSFCIIQNDQGSSTGC
jgi:hypothetical protein